MLYILLHLIYNEGRLNAVIHNAFQKNPFWQNAPGQEAESLYPKNTFCMTTR